MQHIKKTVRTGNSARLFPAEPPMALPTFMIRLLSLVVFTAKPGLLTSPGYSGNTQLSLNG